MAMIPALIKSHRLIAQVDVGLALFVLVWQTTGIIEASIPGFEEIWGDAPSAQYSRRVVDQDEAEWWRLFYKLMYGVGGMVAQVMGLLISTSDCAPGDTVTRSNRTRAQVIGLFQVVIGIHHIVWACTMGQWGRMSLHHLSDALYAVGGLVSAQAFWHGLQLLLTPPNAKQEKVLRHKVLLDTTFLTFIIPLLGFLAANNCCGADGAYRDKTFEMMVYGTMFSAPIIMFVVAWLEDPEKNRKEVKNN
eukprot:CAMPEP_0183717430 /NCGR_PEP_ID=MMETSP0737-20130205/11053_1 /TAXON_ID=385413 /ORGANISM="Thalassiosira miniscula, Strain CCMP1093" /LENGTH=246 /DNA_ID=CAMNT_0025946873 /DNA_START=35 /DNA_END=775 /DNA_ORIENTATION=-